MIRQVLPPTKESTVVALDAAMHQGDLLMVQRLLRLPEWVNVEKYENKAPEWLLRVAAFAYLASKHQMVLKLLDALLNASTSSSVFETALFLQGLVYIDLKQPGEAIAALGPIKTNSLQSVHILPYIPLARATLALYMGEHEAAEDFLSQGRMRYAFHINAWWHWQSLRIKGLITHQTTNYIQARDLLDAARNGFKALGDRYEVARCDKALANTFRRLDDVDAALQHAQAAVGYFNKQALDIPLARCLNTKGAILLAFNQTEFALEHFQTAAKYLESSGLGPELAHTIGNIGLCYRQLSYAKLALCAYERARKLVAEPHIPYTDAMLAEYQGALYWFDDQVEQAIETTLEAIRLFEQAGAEVQVALCQRKLGHYLMESNRLDEAQKYLELSSQTFLQHQSPVQAALTTLQLSRLYLTRSDRSNAKTLLETSAAILQKHGRTHEAATAEVWLAEIKMAEKRYNEAEAFFTRALNSTPSHRLEVAWRAWYGLGRIARLSGETTAALSSFKKAVRHINRLRQGALSPNGAARLAIESQSLYKEGIETALKANDKELALTLQEAQKAIQLIERLRSSLITKIDPANRPRLDEPDSLAQYSVQLNALRVAIHQARIDEDGERLVGLENKFQRLTQIVETLNAPFAGLFEPQELEVGALREQLDQRHGHGKWGCLAYGWLGTKPSVLHYFWLDSANIQAVSIPLNQLDHHFLQLACHPEASYRYRLLVWQESASPPLEWQRLEEILIPDTLRGPLSEVQTLYIAPSGPLAAFPFAALRVGGQFLGLTHDWAQIPSLPFLAALLRRSGTTPQKKGDTSSTRPPSIQQLSQIRGLVCAVSTFPNHPDVATLQSAGREAAALLRHLNASSLHLTNENATLATWQDLFERGALADFQLFHFSTHVRFHPYNARLSHILLSDGALYTSDILQWHLRANIAVLAACDTAVGHVLPGDEQMGLPHAFLAAGADSVIAALWPIADEPTAVFLTRFYDELRCGANSYAAALRQARVRSYRKAPQPFAWAAFVLMGVV